jgi:hypothetical protein
VYTWYFIYHLTLHWQGCICMSGGNTLFITWHYTDKVVYIQCMSGDNTLLITSNCNRCYAPWLYQVNISFGIIILPKSITSVHNIPAIPWFVEIKCAFICSWIVLSWFVYSNGLWGAEVRWSSGNVDHLPRKLVTKHMSIIY